MTMKYTDCSVGVFYTLFILFFILKLAGVIDWSWWIVTLPLWITPAIILGICSLLFVLCLIGIIIFYIVEGIFTLINKIRDYIWQH